MRAPPETVDAAPLRGMRALALAPVGGFHGFNTSVHRMQALVSLGLQMEVIDSAGNRGNPLRDVDTRLRAWMFRKGLRVGLPDRGKDAGRLLAAAERGPWDIFWLEKALTIGARQMKSLRRASPDAMILGFSPDDMSARHNQSQQFLEAIPHYDAFLTTKSYNVVELRAAGCPRVLLVGNGYDPAAFRPMTASREDVARLGGDVGFIGSFERDRADAMNWLAEQGLRVRVWGGGWDNVRVRHPNLVLERQPLYGDDFAIACGAFKINLGFLRKLNRDQQTTRSVEIPACGGFMLAERTPEHMALFAEGEEAEFFSSVEELAYKCKFYLEDDFKRTAIARRGYQRCLSGGYSNAARLGSALASLTLGADSSTIRGAAR